MKLSPFTDWADVPLSCSIEDVARLTRKSVTTIRRQVDAHLFHPMPMPRFGKTSPMLWSKDELMREFAGGHAERTNRKRCFSKRVA